MSAASVPTRRPDGTGLRVLGFPLHIRPGFLFFMLLIVVINGPEYGLWLAGALAAFTLIHELGHALVARQAGATAEISLEFMVGYASFRPQRPLTRKRQVLIAFSGPFAHIVAGSLVLVAMGASPLVQPDYGDHAAYAVWWAGPVIGAFNLLPLVPLDGGNIVSTALDRVLPGRAERVVLIASIVVTIGAGVWLAVVEHTRGFVVFVGLLLIMQLSSLESDRNRRAVSPFDRASEALRAGDERRARRVLVNGLRRPSAAPVVPGPLSDDDAGTLVALLPEPLPMGDPWNEYVLANLLVRTGRLEDAARYAADSYVRQPRTLIAATVARAAAGLGDEDTAVAWLRAAADVATADDGLAQVIDGAPE
ncbi:MAG: hypothetical protein H0W46_05055, partial [Acidimicrobiia bacterium]|nr:hypothetical protein [Acidimicrobiia bacterium]